MTPEEDPSCEAPFPGQDPNIFEACCQDYGGGAHCVPDGLVPEDMRGMVAACDGGGLCIPDPFIESGGVVQPRKCSSINGPGRCMSVCIPRVQESLDILTQDVCDEGERCAPCIDPITNESTGACEVVSACDDDTTPDPDPITCPYEGPPLLDPAAFPSCASCDAGGAHCMPNQYVPGEFANKLADCDTTSKCVPDAFIASLGKHVPETCASVGGGEGRCLSPCLPDVAAQADRLEQSSCGPNLLCAPCFDPLSGQSTGACDLSCDAGASQPPLVFPACCGDRGTCVPSSLAGDDADRLGQEECPDGNDYVCAPNVMINGDYIAQECQTGFISFFFGDEYERGACLPDCLPDVDNFLLGRDGCQDGYKCAPCLDPLSGEPSGACDFLANPPTY